MDANARHDLITALRLAAGAEADELRANPGADTWSLPGAEPARSLTAHHGMSWDFKTWADALACAESGMLGGVSTEVLS